MTNKNTTSDYSYWDSKLVIRLLSKDSYNLKFAINKIISYFFDEKNTENMEHLDEAYS